MTLAGLHQFLVGHVVAFEEGVSVFGTLEDVRQETALAQRFLHLQTHERARRVARRGDVVMLEHELNHLGITVVEVFSDAAAVVVHDRDDTLAGLLAGIDENLLEVVTSLFFLTE